jgi:hypothetical protein
MGATIHMHFCTDKLVGWSLWYSDKDKKCSDCGMKEKKNDCCKDEHKQVKLNTVHQKSATAQNIQFIDAPVLVTPIADFSVKGIAKSKTFRVTNAPPKIPGERLYILYSAYLI